MSATILAFQPRLETVERIVADVASTMLNLLADPRFDDNRTGLQEACVTADRNHHVHTLLGLLEATRVLRATQNLVVDMGHEIAALDVDTMTLDEAERLRTRSRAVAEDTVRTLIQTERMVDALRPSTAHATR